MNELVPLRARFGPFLIDEREERLSKDGMRVELPPRSLAVLCELVRRPGQLVPDELLLDRVWGHRHVSESVVRTVVSHLRQALGDDPRNPRYVETATRRGYRFVAEVRSERTLDMSPAEAPPLPRMPTEGRCAAPPLFGRDESSRLLQDAWQQAERGVRKVVFIGGEAGIGKTALVDDFLASLPDGTAVARSQCVEHYGTAEAYMPLLEALNALCRTAVGPAIRERLSAVAPSWLLQMPWLMGAEERRSLRHEMGAATQERMLRELGELLDRSGDAAPIVVVFEDLHWSDHATVQALAFVAHRRTASPLLLIGTFRPTELIIQQHPLAKLRHELKMRHLCNEVMLEPLSQRHLGDWLERRFGARVPDELAQALHDRTSGLPLFVEHVIQEWMELGVIRRSEDEWTILAPEGFALPGGVVQTIEQHIARLTPQEQRLLGAASVGGIEFSSLCLADVLDAAPEAIAADLETLAARVSWLRPGDVPLRRDGRLDLPYSFRHSLHRQAILQSLPLSQSVAWHKAWAAALERHHEGDLADVAAQVSLHLERGREPAAAARRLVDVAGRAIARGAPEDAIRSARHGLRLLASTPDRGCEQRLHVLEAVALTRMHVVSTPQVAEAFARTSPFDDIPGPARLRATHGRWWVCFSRAQFGAARRLAQDIGTHAQASEDAFGALVGQCAMGMTLAMEGNLASARTTLTSALEQPDVDMQPGPLGPMVQDPLVDCRATLALVEWLSGDLPSAREQAQRAVDLAVARRHPLSEVSALYLAAAMHALAGEFDAVDALVRRLRGVIQTHALSTTASGFDWLHGRALVAQGRHEEGLAEMRRAAESAVRCGLLVTLDSFHLHHADALRVTDRPDLAEAAAREGLALVETTGMRLLEAALWRQLALSLHAQGDAAGARSAGMRAAAVAHAQGASFLEMQARASAMEHGWPVEVATACRAS